MSSFSANIGVTYIVPEVVLKIHGQHMIALSQSQLAVDCLGDIWKTWIPTKILIQDSMTTTQPHLAMRDARTSNPCLLHSATLNQQLQEAQHYPPMDPLQQPLLSRTSCSEIFQRLCVEAHGPVNTTQRGSFDWQSVRLSSASGATLMTAPPMVHLDSPTSAPTIWEITFSHLQREYLA